MIEDIDVLKKYNTIYDKVSSDIEKESDSKRVYNKIFLKTKMKSYRDEAAGFYNKETFRAASNHICLAAITIDSVFKKDESYYLLVFLKICKFNESKSD